MTYTFVWFVFDMSINEFPKYSFNDSTARNFLGENLVKSMPKSPVSSVKIFKNRFEKTPVPDLLRS